MGRLGWFMMGAIGFGLVLLIVNHDTGRTIGLPNDAFAHVLYTGVWGAVIVASMVGTGLKFGDMIRQGLIWVVIMLGLVAGYQYRFDLQDMASRISAGLVPASPFMLQGENGEDIVTVNKSLDNHFRIRALVDGTSVNFLVDTGATDTVLTYFDAQAIGIDTESLVFNRPVNTANGQTFSARARVGRIKIGTIELDDFAVSVSQPDDLSKSLLGMSALNRLSGFAVRGDQLQLYP